MRRMAIATPSGSTGPRSCRTGPASPPASRRASNQYSIYGCERQRKQQFAFFQLAVVLPVEGLQPMSCDTFQMETRTPNIPEVLEGSYAAGVGDVRAAVGMDSPWATNVAASRRILRQPSTARMSSSDFLGYSYSGTIDTYTGTAAFQPTQKFHFSVSTDYSDNLSGSLFQAITATGGIVTPPAQGESSHAFDVLGYASYAVMSELAGAGLGGPSPTILRGQKLRSRLLRRRRHLWPGCAWRQPQHGT
jgi:hypothetical protein